MLNVGGGVHGLGQITKRGEGRAMFGALKGRRALNAELRKTWTYSVPADIMPNRKRRADIVAKGKPKVRVKKLCRREVLKGHSPRRQIRNRARKALLRGES